MNILLVLIPCSLALGGLALLGFVWTIRSAQYDDPAGAANRILLPDGDEDSPPGV